MIEKPTSPRLGNAIKKALIAYADPERWKGMQKAGMAQDFSWRVSARQYYPTVSTSGCATLSRIRPQASARHWR